MSPVELAWRSGSLLVIAVVVHLFARGVIVRLIRKMSARTKTTWDDLLVQHKVFDRLAHIAPGMVLYFGCLIAFPGEEWNAWIQRVATAYMSLLLVFSISAFLSATVEIYRTMAVSRGRPIKGLVQMIQTIVWLVGIVIVVALLMDQSPWKFLTGIGALSAVLLLVFKDSILGLVASFQVSSNDMVRIGDWVEMPKYGADGSVLDISLNTVKVQNWDKTISTIPTYALIADPVKNWRGMSDSDGRRIKRSICIDMHTVRFCTDEMLDRFENFEHVADHIKARRREIADHNKEHGVDTERLVNGRRITNLGVFRAYIIGYLRNHKNIHREGMTFLVRQLAPSAEGLPIEIYVFSRVQEWVSYEEIQADIFDHILSAVAEFDLAVFQAPSGRDFRGLTATS